MRKELLQEEAIPAGYAIEALSQAGVACHVLAELRLSDRELALAGLQRQFETL
jgi:hypothetical protein